jgi:RNA polymerase sigma-70 factor (ECF subfamily)
MDGDTADEVSVGHGHGGVFPATSWSVVRRFQRGGELERKECLEWICRSYWKPVHAWLRARGMTPADAEDTAQDFFARLIAGDWLAGASESKGRLRSLLLVMLKRHAATAHAAKHARKRGGDILFVSVDEERSGMPRTDLPADEESPDFIFDREWVCELLNRVVGQLRADYEAAGKGALFEELRNYLAGDSDDESYGQSAGRLGMSTGAVKVAACRLRERYRIRLREEVAETVEDPGLVDEEIRELLSLFHPAARRGI